MKINPALIAVTVVLFWCFWLAFLLNDHQQKLLRLDSELQILRTRLSSVADVNPKRARTGHQRVVLLRQNPSHTRPQPPLSIASSLGHQIQSKRLQGGYSGNSTDAGHIGGWKRNDTSSFEPKVWSWLIETLRVRSLIDVGCGSGVVVKYFLERGVDAWGVEASNEAIQTSFLPRDRIVQHDFTRGPWFPPEGQVVDVAYTVEFLEHVEEKYLDNVVALLKSARYLIMAASRHGGWSHVNVHRKWWWIEKMEAYGFVYSPEITEIVTKLVLTHKEIDRGYSYLFMTGLVFRNPELDFDDALNEPSNMEDRMKLWENKRESYLQKCQCF
mmetsp:Transcript_24291/g.33452  ORF Transcript_24291/g.33452 Transcript_24291/m.33452 type:complete len:328 (+) Transcript_24291:67-1050(+)